MQNTYANECFMDELAAAANADPIEFRMKYLDPSDKRGLEVLTRLKTLAKWETRPSPQPPGGSVAKGRGMSYVKYELVRTYVAAVADVEIDSSSGLIHVTRIAMTHDCGQIINPDGVRNQIEGNILQAISRTLIEELKFDRSMVTSLDWASYPIITFNEIPDEIDIVMIPRPDLPPMRVGEPASESVWPGVANAIFDAVGVRLRQLPFTPARVLEALSGPRQAAL